MGSCISNSERIERIIPDPNNPGEMIKKIEKQGSCRCTSRLGRNGNSLKFSSSLDYNNTTFENVSAKQAKPLTSKNHESSP